MNIERINENQLKIILTQADLAERNLNISELVYNNDINELVFNNEKMHLLFKEMMDLIGSNFRSETNTEMMIESALLSSDSIMIIVTKVKRSGERPQSLDLGPRSDRQFRKRPVLKAGEVQAKSSGLHICFFQELNDAIMVSARLRAFEFESSALYKIVNKYCLIIRNHKETPEPVVSELLSEYGQRRQESELALAYVMERGEEIIRENAVEKLAAL